MCMGRRFVWSENNTPSVVPYVLVLLRARCLQSHALRALLNTCLVITTTATEWRILGTRLLKLTVRVNLKSTAPDNSPSAYRTTIRRPRLQCTCLVSSSTLRQLDRLHGCEDNTNTKQHHSPRMPNTACEGTKISLQHQPTAGQ